MRSQWLLVGYTIRVMANEVVRQRDDIGWAAKVFGQLQERHRERLSKLLEACRAGPIPLVYELIVVGHYKAPPPGETTTGTVTTPGQ